MWIGRGIWELFNSFLGTAPLKKKRAEYHSRGVYESGPRLDGPVIMFTTREHQKKYSEDLCAVHFNPT